MLAQLLPRRIDNDYTAPRVVPWLFGATLLFRSFCAVNSTFNSHFVARISEGIPVASYPAAAGQTFAALLGMRGLAQLMMCVLGLIVLVRYRALIPLLFTLTLVESVGHILIVQRDPYAAPGLHPAGILYTLVLLVALVGLPLSLRTATTGAAGPRQPKESAVVSQERYSR